LRRNIGISRQTPITQWVTPLFPAIDGLLTVTGGVFGRIATQRALSTYTGAGISAVLPPAAARRIVQSGKSPQSKRLDMECKALVADSSSQVRMNIVRSLNEIGVRDVVEATDGDHAIKLLESGKFNVVFAEWNTQLAEGEALVKAARKMDGKLPIIVTAPQSKKIAELKKSCPAASNYLTLPFTTEQLRKTVGEFVPTIAG